MRAHVHAGSLRHARPAGAAWSTVTKVNAHRSHTRISVRPSAHRVPVTLATLPVATTGRLRDGMGHQWTYGAKGGEEG